MVRALLVLLIVGAQHAQGDEPKNDRSKVHTPRMSYLENEHLKIGADLNLGGAITYLSPVGRDANLINNDDWGRQVQMSYYGGPVPFVVGDKRPAKH